MLIYELAKIKKGTVRTRNEKMELNRLCCPCPVKPLTKEQVEEILAEPKPDLANWNGSDKEKAHVQSATYIITEEDAKNPYRSNPIGSMSKSEKPTEDSSTCMPVEPTKFSMSEQKNQVDDSSKTASAKAASNGQEPSITTPTELTVLPTSICTGMKFSEQDYGNVLLLVVADYHYLDRDGNDDEAAENEVEIQVHTKVTGILLGLLRIAYRDIPSIARHVKNKFPTAIFQKDAVRDGLPEDDVRKQLSSAKIIECHTRAGWNMVGGSYLYLFKNCPNSVNACTKLNLPYYQGWGHVELAKTWQVLCSLYRDGDICKVLLLFVFSGVTFKLFELAEHPLEFLLFITGKTGSMKSSIAKVLYMQLARDEMRERPRRIDMDTGTSFERALVESGFDTVSLFDDYAPPKTASEKAILQDNFERVIRMVGDRSTKSRSNRKLEDCQGEGVHGSVVITGEIMGEGLSSNLRCLYCNIERDKVNVDSLTWLQNCKYGITTIIKLFSDYVAANWNNLLDMIRCQYPVVRQNIQASGIFSHFRTNEKYTYFTILARIMKDFFHYYNCTDAETSSFFDNLDGSIIRTLSMGETSVMEYDPIRNFMRGFIDLMSVGKIKIAQKKPIFHELSTYDGFEDEDFIYVLETKLYTKVRESLLISLTPFYLSLRETKTMLAEEGFSVSSPNGKGKRTFSARINIEGSNQKVDFIKLRKKKLADFTDGKAENF